MTRHISRMLVSSALVLAVTASAVAVLSDAAAAGVRHGVVLKCGLVTNAELSSTLGFHVSSVQPIGGGNILDCAFVGSPGALVTIQFKTGQTKASLLADFKQNNSTAAVISGIGEVGYTTTVQFPDASSFATLKHGIAVKISARVSLAKVEALAKKILLSLP